MVFEKQLLTRPILYKWPKWISGETNGLPRPPESWRFPEPDPFESTGVSMFKFIERLGWGSSWDQRFSSSSKQNKHRRSLEVSCFFLYPEIHPFLWDFLHCKPTTWGCLHLWNPPYLTMIQPCFRMAGVAGCWFCMVIMSLEWFWFHPPRSKQIVWRKCKSKTQNIWLNNVKKRKTQSMCKNNKKTLSIVLKNTWKHKKKGICLNK